MFQLQHCWQRNCQTLLLFMIKIKHFPCKKSLNSQQMSNAQVFLFYFLHLTACLCFSQAQQPSPSTILNNEDVYKVFRFYTNTTDDLHFVLMLQDAAAKLNLNFWTETVRTNSPVDVMIPEKSIPYIEQLCQINNIMYEITIENVHKLIQEKKAMAEKRKKFSRTFKDFVGSKRPLYDHSDYQSYNKMYRFMEALENAYPENAKVLTLGKTRNGKPIYMIKIAENLNASGKKGFWINAGIHAREWASSSTAMYIIDQARSYKFEGLIWYIVPLLNVDGYEFTRRNTHPDVRLWRKNRSPAECLNNGQCCRGVDLNRNFNFNFGGQGSSTDPCDETFQGPFAFSEPESRAVRDFVLAHKNHLGAFIDLHTYSQLWIHPYGHRPDTYPADVDDLKMTGIQAINELYSLYGTRYKVGSDPASGGMADWVKSATKIKYTYLIELRPDEWVYDGFILDQAQILPTARETWQGIKVVADAVLRETHKASIRSAFGD
ncbi:Carboxypeptidase A1 [Trichinella murrelli]|uniref:Carboxypeptidase A1 n=1 Tax=Trichinella murrelli TaxID=144512 RepID=A0A0V0UCF7_9BILA|nr:Carboxypeptidase A1 [Trichinella murrelli]